MAIRAITVDRIIAQGALQEPLEHLACPCLTRCPVRVKRMVPAPARQQAEFIKRQSSRHRGRRQPPRLWQWRARLQLRLRLAPEWREHAIRLLQASADFPGLEEDACLEAARIDGGVKQTLLDLRVACADRRLIEAIPVDGRGLALSQDLSQGGASRAAREMHARTPRA